MSFSTKYADSFARVLEKSPYNVLDQVVKIQYVQKGGNVIFGRIIKDEDYRNLIYIGKILETASPKSYLGCDAWLDVTFPHVVYITGTRGSGKSFDLGVILEGISELGSKSEIQNDVNPITTILIDTQSQFWTLRFPPNPDIPANKSQLNELERWNIKPSQLVNTKVFVPPGSTKFLGDEIEFTVRPADVTHGEWCGLLGQEVYSPQGHVLGRTLEALAGRNFSVQEMIDFIDDATNWPTSAESTRNAASYKLQDYARTGLFAPNGIAIKDLLKKGVCNILMLRDIRNEDKSLITAVIARQLFTIMGEHHTKRKVSEFFGTSANSSDLPDRVWLLIDEAHVVAPKDTVSPARDALVEYVKRGRDAGLSLVLATQQPSAVDDRILSQVNITFSHRLTFQSDITSAENRIPTKIIGQLKMAGTTLSDFGDMMRVLDAGQCFMGDQATSRAMMVQIRPRVSAHGGYSPI
ncbi:ATP-binding protein [Mesorhizobium sp. B1-1-4]|uniref:ATP-binding protein n=1 Tax=Mesorhizobium sp. B1-1-4 TaxID=2589980 RepID=UPI00112B5339|nr:ATP-binding protein [Mesorhizobium sp. B1-1-4]TPN59649.1 ATP-binding protein [Mesorhizobium sp. B1-1-4]